MKIKSFQGGYDKNLSYIIWCEKTKHAALIDASTELTPIKEYIDQHNLELYFFLLYKKLFFYNRHIPDFSFQMLKYKVDQKKT